MSDIVERLRISEHEWDHDPRLYLEAADQIERLRTENRMLELELEEAVRRMGVAWPGKWT